MEVDDMTKARVFDNCKIKTIQMTDETWSLSDVLDSLITSEIVENDANLIAWYTPNCIIVSVENKKHLYIPHEWTDKDE
jgi:hypothetical protein